MRTRIRNMNGEQLLLAAVFGGPSIQVIVGQELDRRALLGAVGIRARRPGARYNALAGFGRALKYTA